MTTFLSGPGFGGPQPTTVESQALRDINSRQKTFVNKDFTKNIAWLNQSVDTLSAYTQKLQKGVEDANQNALEQVQGIWGDLFVMLAGLEPTGIHIGDVKYVLQGLGALLGINPGTPFPLNLVEAAWHLFSTYVIPLDQFTDVIFDAIFAWAEELGLSPEFIDALKSLRTALEAVTDSFENFFDSLSELLSALGFMDFTDLGNLLAEVLDLFDAIALTPLKPVIAALADLGIPWINALTAIVQLGNRFLDPFGAISGDQIAELSANWIPSPSALTTVWSIGGDSTNAWVFDDTQNASPTSAGSLTTLGTGVAKRVQTQKKYDVQSGKKFTVSAQLRWGGIPTGANDFGIRIIWYQGGTEMSTSDVNISGGHGATGGWTQVQQADITVPINIDGFRVAARVGTGITSGQVWIDDLSVQLQGFISQNIISGLIDTLAGFLTSFSPLNALNLFGILGPDIKIPFLDIGALGSSSTNLLVSPGFDDSTAFIPAAGWTFDLTTGRTQNGAAKCTANGQNQEMVSVDIAVAEGQKMSLGIWVRWAGVSYTSTNHAQLRLLAYNGTTLSATNTIASQTFTVGTQATWQQLSGDYTVPAGVTKVVLSLRVNSNVTAGVVWFDDASTTKTGLIQLPWVQDAVDLFGGVLNMFGLGSLTNLIGLSTGSPNTAWSNIITTLLNPLHVIEDFLGRSWIEEITDAIGNILEGIPFVGGAFAALWASFTDFFDSTEDTAAVASDASLGLTATRESLVGNINGVPVTAPDDAAVDEAIAGQTAIISDLAAQAAALSAVQTGSGNNGVYAIEPFEYVNSTNLDAGLWSRAYLSAHTSSNGTINTADGHNAGFTLVSGTNIDIFEHYIGPNRATLTTYQKVTITVNTQMTANGFFGGSCYVVLYCRVSADGSKWVRARWHTNGTVDFQYKNGGSITALGSSTVTDFPRPPVGTIISLEAGTAGGERVFRLAVGTRTIHTVTDGSAVTALEKEGGFGLIYGDRDPGKYAHWSISDNTPTPVSGKVFRAFRSLTSGATQSSGDVVIASAFDTVEFTHSEFTYDSTTSKVTSAAGGVFLVAIRVEMSSVLDEAQSAEMLLFKQGSVYARIGGDTMLDPPNPTTGMKRYVNGVGIVQLSAGQYLQVGTSSNKSIVGESTGQKTWFSVTKVG